VTDPEFLSSSLSHLRRTHAVLRIAEGPAGAAAGTSFGRHPEPEDARENLDRAPAHADARRAARGAAPYGRSLLVFLAGVAPRSTAACPSSRFRRCSSSRRSPSRRRPRARRASGRQAIRSRVPSSVQTAEHDFTGTAETARWTGCRKPPGPIAPLRPFPNRSFPSPFKPQNTISRERPKRHDGLSAGNLQDQSCRYCCFRLDRSLRRSNRRTRFHGNGRNGTMD